jgi:2-methylcitrate dehydratase PrpD
MAATYHKSGKEFLLAMAIGYKYATRIGYATRRSSKYDKGFHAMINGAPATAAAVGNLIGWDADLIASAIGLAASSSAGLLGWINTDSMTRRTHPASIGQLGVEAAILAQAGVVGCETSYAARPRKLCQHRFRPVYPYSKQRAFLSSSNSTAYEDKEASRYVR